jgi:hypothetical protein
MANLGDLTYHGASGVLYKFTVHPWGTVFKAVGAVYCVTKRTPKSDGGGSHDLIYIGETGDLSERFDAHHKAACMERHGANCICIHVERDVQVRLRMEADLLAEHDPPCND